MVEDPNSAAKAAAEVAATLANISRDAFDIAASVSNGASAESIARAKGKIEMLYANLPAGVSAPAGLASAAATVSSASADDEDGVPIVAAAVASGRRGGRNAALSGAFMSAMQQFLSGDEQSYMSGLNPERQQDFLRIKYHSLSEEDKAKLPPEERKKVEDMGALKESLTEMEKEKESQIRKQEKNVPLAERKIEHVKEKFKKAHKCADTVDKTRKEMGAHAVQAALGNPMAGIMLDDAQKRLKNAEGELRKTLKDDVIDDALLEKQKSPTAQKDQSVDVAPVPMQESSYMPPAPGTGRKGASHGR